MDLETIGNYQKSDFGIFHCLLRIYSTALVHKTWFFSLQFHFSFWQSPLAKNCSVHRATADWLTHECVSSCVIAPITATSPTNRCISCALGREFQKKVPPWLFPAERWKPAHFYPQCLSAAQTRHTWLLFRHPALHIHYKAWVFFPTPVELGLVVDPRFWRLNWQKVQRWEMWPWRGSWDHSAFSSYTKSDTHVLFPSTGRLIQLLC